MLFSSFLNKKIITKKGNFIGYAKDIIINFRERKVEYISLVDIKEILKEKDLKKVSKKLIKFNRVLKIGDAIVISD